MEDITAEKGGFTVKFGGELYVMVGQQVKVQLFLPSEGS